MTHVPERLRNITLPARLAAILLLLVWVGPVTFAQTGSWELLRWIGAPGRASGEARVIPAGMAMQIEVGTLLKLHMRDGSAVEGRFIGRGLLDPAVYASRFAARADSSDSVALALGETLSISLRDGREWSAPFAGYAELALLLRSANEPARRVPFESAREIRRANGGLVDPATLARQFHAGALPSAEVLVLTAAVPVGATTAGWPETRQVAVEDIEWATMELPPVGSNAAHAGMGGESVAGIVLLSVTLSFAVVYLWLKSASTGGCSSNSRWSDQAAED